MSQTENHVTSTVAKVNNVDILLIENGEKRVAIKPICEALGIDHSAQISKIKNDPILGSTMGLSTTVGADNKSREMQTIPFMFVFGWLFTIDPRNVKPEAADAVIKYKLECYKALYDHFTQANRFLEEKEKTRTEIISQLQEAELQADHAKEKVKLLKSKVIEIGNITLQDYINNNRQLKIEFPQS